MLPKRARANRSRAARALLTVVYQSLLRFGSPSKFRLSISSSSRLPDFFFAFIMAPTVAKAKTAAPSTVSTKKKPASSLSAKLGTPAQHSQPSRKGKRAWRKNIDIGEVEEGLEEIRQEERVVGFVLTICCNLLASD